ncbi:MAG TPA: aldehyde dehydrogenase (NADP(+)) [Acidimicrobiales bacterium]
MTHVISLNPATGGTREIDLEETSLAEVAWCCERAAGVAIEVATHPLSWREALLRAMADELDADAAALVGVAMEETALPKARLDGELRRAAFQLRFFADVVADGEFLAVSIDHPGDSPMGPLPDLRRMRVPLGPVAVFGSSNFPFAFSVPGGDTSSALAAGCPVVIKAHPAHPETSKRCFESMLRGARTIGAPEGLLTLVFGFEAGVALVDDPAICAVGFTGSVQAGRALWARANARPVPIPFFGELGSANPLVVTPGAAKERASEIGVGIGSSMTLGVGQFCTKPGLLFIPGGEHGDALVAALVASLRELSPMTMLAPGIASHFRDGARAITAVAGTSLLVGEDLGVGTSVTPQLLEVGAGTFADTGASSLREECFGPLAVVVRYQTHDELAAALEVADPALTFSFFSTANDPDAPRLAALGEQKAGRVIANGYPTGVGVSWSMQHGGPWPATTAPAATSVGAAGIERWLRPVTFQNMPAELLPAALRDDNPLGIPQRVDGERR